jgi:hypothetical protein
LLIICLSPGYAADNAIEAAIAAVGEMGRRERFLIRDLSNRLSMVDEQSAGITAAHGFSGAVWMLGALARHGSRSHSG